MSINKYTPIVKQYLKIKLKYPDMLIFYRVGDFYEFFLDDAYKASKLLNLNLTKKGISTTNPIPMAGIPYYVLNNYIIKLINLGESLVICEQIENDNDISFNNKIKKIKERKVVKIITPGTLTEDFLLLNNQENILAALYQENDKFAYATLNLISGNFYLYNIDNINKLKIKLHITNPNELLYSENFKYIKILNKIKCIKKRCLEDFDINENFNILIKQFNIYNLHCFGINNNNILIRPAGCIIKYLINNQPNISFPHITKLIIKQDKDYLILDKVTIKKLEINNNNNNCLIKILDKTSTYMGSRLLKNWILNPITNLKIISNRQNSISYLILYYENLKLELNKISDLERIIARLSMLTIKPKDLINLNNSIQYLINIKNKLNIINNKYIIKLNKKIFIFKNINILLSKAINNDYNDLNNNNEQIIANGYNKKLDKLRKIVDNKFNYIRDLENKEKIKLNISNLKIKFNNKHGYYIQINNKNNINIPKSYIIVQKLKYFTRYITSKLKKIELKLINAKSKINLLERKIFNKIISFLLHYLHKLLLTTKAIAELDVLTNLAERSKNLNYYKPNFTHKCIIKYSKGRHPIIEYNKSLPFINNSLLLSNKYNNSIIITGPNMGGKSTYLRQTALIVLMAYIGCFVPAENVIIGPIDRIFVRLGYTDNPTKGKSTFMVEMNEIANILNNATKYSLVLIDEIGRGTSTKDGIALAWAILYYLSNFIKCMTILATHFYKIIKLEKKKNKIHNMYFNAYKINHQIIFNYNIKYGFNKQSYGLIVAKLAGLPKIVINIAKKITLIK